MSRAKLIFLLLLVAVAAAGTIARAGDDPPARFVYERGKLLESRGDQVGALAEYISSSELAREQGDRHLESTILNRMGLLYESLHRNKQALAAYKEALVVRTDLNDLRGMGQVHNNIHIVYQELGNSTRSLEHIRKAYELGIRAQGPVRTRLLPAETNLVAEYRRRGDFSAATRILDRIRSTLPRRELNRKEAEIEYADAKLRYFFDRYREAETLYRTAKGLFAAKRDLRMEAYSVLGLARIQRAWHGDCQRAGRLADEADELFSRISNRWGNWTTGLERVKIALSAKMWKAAAEHLGNTWEIGKTFEARARVKAEHLYYQAKIAYGRERYDLAFRSARKALTMARLAGNLINQALCYYLLFQIEAQRDDSPAAIAMMKRAIRIFSSIRDYDDVVKCHARLARFLASRGLIDQARYHLGLARAALEHTFSHRTRLGCLMAEAEVEAYAGDDDGHRKWMDKARTLAEEQSDRIMLEKEIGPLGEKLAAVLNSPKTNPSVAQTTAPGQPAAQPAPGGPGAAVHPVPQPIALSPSSAQATVLVGEVARYRWTLASLVNRELEVRVWVEGKKSKLLSPKGSSPVCIWTFHGDHESNPVAVVPLTPYGSAPIFINSLSGDEESLHGLFLKAQAAGAAGPVGSYFLVRFSSREEVESVVGRGIEGDPHLVGIEFYHEIRLRGETVRPVDVMARSSRPCYLEVVKLTDSQMVAVDANGNGDYTDPGDQLYQDEDDDLLPDFSPPGETGVVRFLIIAYPLGEDAESRKELSIDVSITDRSGKVVSTQRDILLFEQTPR